MLQQDLNTASHSTEELIEKRQILNSVLIQQVSQPWKLQTTESQRSELFQHTAVYIKYLLLCTFLQSSCEMFTQQLLLHGSNEWLSEQGEEKKKQLRLQINLCQCLTAN